LSPPLGPANVTASNLGSSIKINRPHIFDISVDKASRMLYTISGGEMLFAVPLNLGTSLCVVGRLRWTRKIRFLELMCW